jgi:hypothetical protein
LRVVTTCYNPRNAYGIGSGPSSEGFVPIISEMPGFVAYYLVDAGDGVMVSTSVFEHKDAEEQSNFRAGEFVAEHLAPLLPNPPQVTAGEVVASKGR